MKITNIEAWKVEMELTDPYTIAYESVNKTTNVFIRIETDRGIIGYGCAAPDKKVTGETSQTVMQSIVDTAIPILEHGDPLRHALLLHSLNASLRSQPSLIAAVDMALFDIVGKSCGVPVWKLLGGFRESILTSITIGILPEAETVALAKKWVKEGFKAIKIKGGIDVACDIARVIKVREVVGDAVQLRFDANQGFSVSQALEFVEKTRWARLELIEQPTPKGQPNLLGRISNNVSVPIMADESLVTLRDAFRLAQGNFVDMVNIKLMKVGGIAEALQVNAVAKAAGLDVMVGCMDEASLAIAAGLHFALARPNVKYADLDGQIGLKGDPSTSALVLRQGVLYPTERPGLGLEW